MVLRTDTLYGIVTNALNKGAVLRLQKLRRPSRRPFVVLIPSHLWIRKLGAEAKREELKLLSLGLTVVLKKRRNYLGYLGKESIALRIPRKGEVFFLLKKLNLPLVAPSANLEGKKPATNVREAKRYFKDKALYLDGGKVLNKPSTIVKVEKGKLILLREGNFTLSSLRRVCKRLSLV